MAQRRGFEPPVSFWPTHDFQSCSLNHSDISAYKAYQKPYYITVFFKKMQAFSSLFMKKFQKRAKIFFNQRKNAFFNL